MASPDSLVIALLGIWAGSILYYTLAATPKLFRALGREEAGKVVGLLFGGYYAFGWVCGALTLAALAAAGWPAPRSGLALAALAVALPDGTLVRRWVIRWRDARGKNPRAEARFRAVHGVSMLLNLVVLGLVLAALLV